MRILLGVAPILAILLFGGAAVADDSMSAADAIKLYDSRPDLRDSVDTSMRYLEAGMGWANAELTTGRHQKALYCPPGNLSLVGRQLIEIARHFLGVHPDFGIYPLPAVMLKGLEETFPCH